MIQFSYGWYFYLIAHLKVVKCSTYSLKRSYLLTVTEASQVETNLKSLLMGLMLISQYYSLNPLPSLWTPTRPPATMSLNRQRFDLMGILKSRLHWLTTSGREIVCTLLFCTSVSGLFIRWTVFLIQFSRNDSAILWGMIQNLKMRWNFA